MAQDLVGNTPLRETISEPLPVRAKSGAMILKQVLSHRLTLTNALLVIAASVLALGIVKSDSDFGQKWQVYLPSSLTIILIVASIILVRSIHELHEDCFSLLTLDDARTGKGPLAMSLRARGNGDVVESFLRICGSYQGLKHLAGFGTDLDGHYATHPVARLRIDRMVPVNDMTTIRLGNGRVLQARIRDFSRSGAALNVDLTADVGTNIRVGRLDAIVVRTFADGLAVKFHQQLTSSKFNEHFRL